MKGGMALELRDVRKHFPLRSLSGYGKSVHAMDEVSFGLASGESLALVGESGSGKTTTASVIARIYGHDSGSVVVDGEEAKAFRNRKEALRYRKKVQLIFQDPFGSLNPTHTVKQILERPLLIHGLAKGKDELEARLREILEQVGLSPAEEYLRRFPHELSGGQRQRVNIARGFAVEPEIILADEPTSMLDVSIRMGVMNMMLDLKEKRGVSYLYITHDLAGARYMCSRIAVMYAGMIMEIGPTDEVIQQARHPYVRLLKSASPSPESGLARERVAAKGEIPSLIDPPSGCRFHPRCPYAKPACSQAVPALRDAGSGHLVRCILD
jgi:peptide/nickel transport system ATP-binding protein